MSISIVTISFNQMKFLAEAIDSVLATSESTDLELILIDPGSSDGSREMILEYAMHDSRVRYLFEKDLGPADGLNKGFSLATKDYIGFINSDDYYLPGTIEEVDNMFYLNRDCAVLLGHGFKLRNGKLEMIISDNFNAKSYAFGRCNFLQQSTFYNRSILTSLNVQFNLCNHTCWDGEFLFDIALSGGKLKTVSKLWGVFRIHHDSISGSGKLNEIYKSDRKRITQRYLDLKDLIPNKFANLVSKIFCALLRRTRKVCLYPKLVFK